MSEIASDYRLQIDWDRDGFFCSGVLVTDPLNIIPAPVTWHGLRWDTTATAVVVSLSHEATDYGTKVLNVNTGGVLSGGVLVGQNPETNAIDEIPVAPGTQYTAKVWLYVVSAVGVTNLTFEVRDQQPVVLATSSIAPSIGVWTAYTLTFTTNANSAFVRLAAFKRTDADTVIFKLAGPMVVAGGTAPTAFNAGDPSNPYDDIWDLCEGVRVAYGMPQYTEAVAPASSMTVDVSNIDGVFSPENPPLARSRGAIINTLAPAISATALVGVELTGDDGSWLLPGFFSRGMLGRLQADYGGSTYTLYIGTLDSVVPDAGTYNNRGAQLLFTDPVPQLNAAQYNPPLLEDVTTGEALQDLFDSGAVLYPYPGAFWLLDVEGASELGDTTWLFENTLTDFDAGETELVFAGDTTGSGLFTSAVEFIRDNVYAELGGRFFWDGREGKFKFYSRERDILYAVNSGSPGALELDEPPEYVWGDDLMNRVTVTYYPRVVGAAASVMYTLGNTPLTLSAGQARQMTVRYLISDALNASVAGRDMILPVAGLDYNATLNADGTGGDATTSVTVICTFNALNADLTLINNSGAPVYLQAFRLRGTPLISYRAVQVGAYDGPSIIAQGEHPRTVHIPALGDADLASTYANYLVQRYKEPIGRIRAASVLANRDAATMVKVLDMAIGDHITLYDTFLNNQSTAQVVTAMTHTISSIRTHRLRLTVEPLDRYVYWILDDAALSILDSTTRLSF